MNSKQKGNISENIAVDFLINKGFNIIQRNVYVKKFGEIDVIASKGGVLHFVEVKSGGLFEPIYNITPLKLSRLVKSIDFYINKQGIDMPYCIDAIIIKNNHIDFIENITVD